MELRPFTAQKAPAVGDSIDREVEEKGGEKKEEKWRLRVVTGELGVGCY